MEPIGYILFVLLDRTIAALADPTRRELLRRLANQPCRAGELAQGFAISRPAVVKHTRKLQRAGLIKARKSGRERIYELAPGGRAAVDKLIVTLKEVGAFWDVALDAFKTYVEAKK
jgi:DNA-binding transcriptional ArsR family regulator